MDEMETRTDIRTSGFFSDRARLAGLWLAFGLLLYGLGWLSTHFFPTDSIWKLEEPVSSLALYQRALSPGGTAWDPILRPWFRWDAAWYMRIALDGYGVLDSRQAFAPLYPLLVRILGGVFGGNLMLAALVISAGSLLITIQLLFKFVQWKSRRGEGFSSVLILLSFPTSFFLWGAYSESLFLALTLATFIMAERRRWGWAGMLGALSVLTRFQGAFIIVPLAWMIWRDERRLSKNLLWLILIPLALISFVVYVRWVAAGVFPWDELASHWDKQWALPWTGIIGNARYLFQTKLVWVNALPYVLDLVCAIGVGALCAMLFIQDDTVYGMWGFSLLLMAICSISVNNTLISVSRYVLGIFPAFVLLESILSKRWRYFWLGISVCIQLFLAALFFEWVWIA
jgi:hypothetical protein